MRQPRLPFPRKRHYLRREAVEAALGRQGLHHFDLARLLRLSASYWSRLVNRHRHLTPRVRDALLRCPALAGLGQVELWDVVEVIPEVTP
ncbi:MAG: hypothetical protein ABIO70_09985 [Pseudomonadota bacterium]